MNRRIKLGISSKDRAEKLGIGRKGDQTNIPSSSSSRAERIGKMHSTRKHLEDKKRRDNSSLEGRTAEATSGHIDSKLVPNPMEGREEYQEGRPQDYHPKTRTNGKSIEDQRREKIDADRDAKREQRDRVTISLGYTPAQFRSYVAKFRRDYLAATDSGIQKRRAESTVRRMMRERSDLEPTYSIWMTEFQSSSAPRREESYDPSVAVSKGDKYFGTRVHIRTIATPTNVYMGHTARTGRRTIDRS